MVEKLSTLFHNMSNDLGEKFDMLVEMDTLDLDTRKGKAPGGYTNTICRRVGYHLSS